MRQGQFELSVLVGGVPLPEMTTGAGEVYVETKFNTASSYKVEVEEVRRSCARAGRSVCFVSHAPQRAFPCVRVRVRR
jgi:hypothetical protein